MSNQHGVTEVERLAQGGHDVGLRPVGVAVGLLSAVARTRWLSSLLFAVSPLDAGTFAVVSLVLVVAAAAALGSYLPSHRATRVNPLDALRAE